jgi:hypothetical protein
VKVSITFMETDDPFMKDVEVDVVPREGEQIGIIPSRVGHGYRLDNVDRVRHYIGEEGHEIHLQIGEARDTPSPLAADAALAQWRSCRAAGDSEISAMHTAVTAAFRFDGVKRD